MAQTQKLLLITSVERILFVRCSGDNPRKGGREGESDVPGRGRKKVTVDSEEGGLLAVTCQIFQLTT